MRAGSGALRAAIIDLDGTMLDTVPDFHVALTRMLAELDLAPISAAAIRDLVGKGSENLIRSVLSRDVDAAGVERLFAQAMDAYQRHYLAINGDHSTLFPGVIEGLAAMKAMGLRLACVTNKPIAFTTPLLAQKGLAPYFELVYGGDSLARKKPDPLPLLKTCEALGTAPAATLVVGDSRNDAAAARAAGCPVVLVTYGYNHGEPARDVDADGWVDSLSQLNWS